MSTDTKQRIIDTAIELFTSKGYSNTSMNDIIDSINISKGSVYWHFPSKEAIYLSVVRESFNQWFEMLDEQLAPLADPVEKIRTYCRLLISTVDIPAWRISPELYWTEFEPSTKAEIEALLAKDDAIIDSLLNEAMDQGLIRKDNTEKIRWIFFALLEGLFEKVILAYKEDPDKLSTEQEYAAEAMDMFLDYLKA